MEKPDDKKHPTPTPKDLEDLWNLDELGDFPTEIKQRDLCEIVAAVATVGRAKEELQARRGDLEALVSQLETQIALKLRIEPGTFTVETSPDGKRKIVKSHREEGLADEDIPF